MSEFLFFTLHAPLTSWGAIAVGEARGSWDRPSRSAILGLVAAALGITREDQQQHDRLDRGYGVAVRLDAPGAPLVDYHTAQTVSASAAQRRGAKTRAQLLEAGGVQTVLSRRTYRQDALATVALWECTQDAWPLVELETALRRPAFTLYAGRKANALGLPLAPAVIHAPTLAGAFLDREHTRGMQRTAPPAARLVTEQVWTALRPLAGWGREVAHDPWEFGETGLRPLRREVRRDTSPHRDRWHFAERVVEVGLLPDTAAAEASA